MNEIRTHILPEVQKLMLVLNNSSIAFSVEGRKDWHCIEIYTNDISAFLKDIEVEQDIDIGSNINLIAIAVRVPKNPKFNIVNHGNIQGQCIGDFQNIVQHFDGNVMHRSVTSSYWIKIVVPENINVSVYNGINVKIEGVKGKVKQ